jgi:hypothetical protein
MHNLLTIITTAVLTYTFTLAVPYVKMKYNAFKHAKKRTKTPDCALMEHNIEVLVEKMNQLEEQMSNVAKNAYRREQNRKSNIRRTVKELLQEIADGKFDK